MYQYGCVTSWSAIGSSGDEPKSVGAFIRRSNLVDAPATLKEIQEPLRRFLIPVFAAITGDQNLTGTWPAGGPWRTEP